MHKFFLSLALGTSLVAMPMIMGCDQTKSEKTEEHKNPDGTSTTEKAKTTTDSNGTTTDTKLSETKNPDGSKTVDSSKKKVDANGNVIEQKDEHKDK